MVDWWWVTGKALAYARDGECRQRTRIEHQNQNGKVESLLRLHFDSGRAHMAVRSQWGSNTSSSSILSKYRVPQWVKVRARSLSLSL
ncbi:unnamed protein product [Linum trigynum]|uniref:Uncharacterized protein n=1 Tax=Linum trigynum TaxID=586398 RepID=A0AAV2EMR7_9ROSI